MARTSWVTCQLEGHFSSTFSWTAADGELVGKLFGALQPGEENHPQNCYPNCESSRLLRRVIRLTYLHIHQSLPESGRPILLIRPNTFFDGIIELGCGANWFSTAGLLSAHLLVFILPQIGTTISIAEGDYRMFVCIIFPSIFLFLFYSDSEHGGTTITEMYAEANVIFFSGVYL